MKLLPAFLLLLTVPLHAQSNEAVSEIFAFDVRDTTGTTEAESGVFSMDARNLGNSASSASSVFALGTQSGNLNAQVIDASAHYRVVRSQELGTLNLDFLQGGAEGTTGPMSFEDAGAPAGRAFYWIEVE